MKILAFVPEAFGGRGGIAQYDRSFLRAVCSHPGLEGAVVLPRIVRDPVDSLPERLVFREGAAGGKIRYLAEAGRETARSEDYAAVFCGHLNLLSPAWLVSRRFQVPLFVALYGIDAWRAGNRRQQWLLEGVDRFVAISEYTKRRFLSWSGVAKAKVTVIPCCLEPGDFRPGPKPGLLLDRYRLRDRTVLLTVGRMSPHERYKGHDRILEILPTIAVTVPDVAYLVVGEGGDRPRLEEKARELGVADRVVFTGFVSESEKADHYRIADAFVMAGWGEGFGIVFLEALACGVPVVVSRMDASQEIAQKVPAAFAADPTDGEDLVKSILGALEWEGPVGVPDQFTYPGLERNVHRLVDSIMTKDARATSSD